MRKPDDSTLTPVEYAKVRSEAERALANAGAFGRFPTPVKDIMAVANVEEVEEDILNEGFVDKMRRKAGGLLKKALRKVLGLFDARTGFVFIDRSLLLVKQTFIRLHEAAHGFLKWQRSLYAVIEECEQTLDPELADQFDKEANAFASEVLFQLDTFSKEAEEMNFSILTPVKMSRKYGASIYSSIRQYVSKNWRACAVIVLNPPEINEGDGFRAGVRRFVASPSFHKIFGILKLPEFFTPNDKIGAMVPVGSRRMSGKRTIGLEDSNGNYHECIAEAFTQKHQVFILLHAKKTLSGKSIVMPAAVGFDE